MRPHPLTVALALTALGAPAAAQTQTRPPFVFTDVDRKLHAEMERLDRLFDQRGLVLHDARLAKIVQDLAKPLAPAGTLELVEWRFRILRDPTVNAFALPNGSIYLNTGLLARAENDDQVAAVLAHEIVHVANRHTYLFNRSLRKKSAALNVIVAAGNWLPFGGALGATLSAALTVSEVAIIVTVYGHSQEMEQEADTVGVERLKATGRDASQLARMFAILDERIEPVPEPIFLRTHAKARKRIDAVKVILGLPADPPPSPDPAYVDRMRPALLHNLRLDLDSRRYRSAVATATRLADTLPTDAESLYWLGEAHRALGPRQPRLSPKELTYWSQRRVYSDEHNRTEEDQAKRLAATPEGRKALAENQARAKDLFDRAAALDNGLALPYLGLGALYQEQEKQAEAVAAYERYLQLAPAGPDRPRVERRLELLRKAGVSR